MTTPRPKSRKAAASASVAPAATTARSRASAAPASKAVPGSKVAPKAASRSKAAAAPKAKRGGRAPVSAVPPPGAGDTAETEAKPEAAEAPKRSRTGTLLIVESPAKAKTIQKYLGRAYTVVASKGHVKDLPKRGGVDIEQGFKETYEVIQEKGKDEVLRTIRDLSKRADRVLLATDPDREGEAIAWHLLEEIKITRPDVEVRRVLFNEITKKGVNDGIAHPRDLDPYLYEAQRTRRVLDRIGGYPLSNLLWRKLAFGLSAGRVQTPALRILVDRQHEIDAFVPTPYWLLEAKLAGPLPPSFVASLDSVGGEKLERVASRPACTSELDAKRFETDLRAAAYKVAKVTKRERKTRAPSPYTTSKLQQDASNRLGMNPKRAMRIAQALYEGIEIKKGGDSETVGLITYMRTDSLRLSAEAVEECREYVEKTYGKAALPAEANVFKSKKQNVQDAHEAVRPTRMDLPPDEVRAFLTDERFRLYKMIWDRFVACQMNPAVYDQTSVEIEGTANGHSYGLRASGSVLKVPGWRAVYGAGMATLAGEESEDDDEDSTRLPPLNEGDTLTLTDTGLVVLAKQTEPPPYYNEASLVKKLEEEGIGRPSTYAEIISKVQARDYVKKNGNKLVPSELGRLVVERLVADKFDLADIDFTRKLEEDLDAIAEARGKRLDVLAPFHEQLQKKIAASMEEGKWWPEPESINEQCPECGKDLKKRWGRNGAFIGCDGYPECKYTRPIPGTGDGEDGGDRRPTLTDWKCELCGSPMMKRWGRNGWFLGCSTFPKCKSTRNLPLGVDCPKCGGEVVEIRGKNRKRPFYGCSNYSKPEIKCDFRSWQRPVPEPCPQCGAKFVVRAGSAKSPMLKCLTEGCTFEQQLEVAGEEAELSPAIGD